MVEQTELEVLLQVRDGAGLEVRIPYLDNEFANPHDAGDRLFKIAQCSLGTSAIVVSSRAISGPKMLASR